MYEELINNIYTILVSRVEPPTNKMWYNPLSKDLKIFINGAWRLICKNALYKAGYGLILNGTVFSVNSELIQKKLTAGTNIRIEDEVISSATIEAQSGILSTYNLELNKYTLSKSYDNILEINDTNCNDYISDKIEFKIDYGGNQYNVYGNNIIIDPKIDTVIYNVSDELLQDSEQNIPYNKNFQIIGINPVPNKTFKNGQELKILMLGKYSWNGLEYEQKTSFLFPFRSVTYYYSGTLINKLQLLGITPFYLPYNAIAITSFYTCMKGFLKFVYYNGVWYPNVY